MESTRGAETDLRCWKELLATLLEAGMRDDHIDAIMRMKIEHFREEGICFVRRQWEHCLRWPEPRHLSPAGVTVAREDELRLKFAQAGFDDGDLRLFLSAPLRYVFHWLEFLRLLWKPSPP